MSIATLKRKTGAQYHNMSVSRPQFSLNGYYRNDRTSIGTNRIQTSIPRTLANGTAYRGFGGNQGTFRISVFTPIGELQLPEQPETAKVKLSTKNTSGLIATKYLWTKLPYPFTTVKRDSNNPENSSSGLYTTNLGQQVAKTVVSVPSTSRTATLNQCNYTKAPSDYTSISQDEYIMKKGGQCINNVTNTIYNLPQHNSTVPLYGDVN